VLPGVELNRLQKTGENKEAETVALPPIVVFSHNVTVPASSGDRITQKFPLVKRKKCQISGSFVQIARKMVRPLRHSAETWYTTSYSAGQFHDR
jgi:hypothetical protein